MVTKKVLGISVEVLVIWKRTACAGEEEERVPAEQILMSVVLDPCVRRTASDSQYLLVCERSVRGPARPAPGTPARCASAQRRSRPPLS